MCTMCLQPKNITSVFDRLGTLNHSWSLSQFGSYPEILQSGRFGALYFKPAFIKCILHWLGNFPCVFWLWNILITIFILWTLQIHGILKFWSTFMVLQINAWISRLTTLEMIVSILSLTMESLLLLVMFIFDISHTPKFLAHINSDYSTRSSSFCSAFLRQDISHASLFCITTHEKFEALMPWNFPCVICFPDGSSSYLPFIQMFLISQCDTHKQK